MPVFKTGAINHSAISPLVQHSSHCMTSDPNAATGRGTDLVQIALAGESY